MVEDRTTDGVRIAQLLSSELTGGGGRLANVTVTDPDPDVEPTTDGALAYRVSLENQSAEGEGEGENDYFAEVYVHSDRARVEFRNAPDAAADAGAEAGLRVRPKAVRPPRTIVFVEDGAQVKRVLAAFEAVLHAMDGSTVDED